MSDQPANGEEMTEELVDPCPNGHVELLDALFSRLDKADEGLTWLDPWQFTEKGLLAELSATQRELARLQARWLALLAEAEQREVTLRVAGLPTASWLTDRNTHWARTARDEVRLALRLAQHPVVAQALSTGALSSEQTQAVCRGLDRLPDDLDAGQREIVAGHLVELGRRFGPYALTRLANRAVEVVAPEVAEDADRRAIERAEARHQRERYLTWRTDPDGAWVFSGRMGAVAGEKLAGVLRAVGANLRRTAALAGEELTRAQAAADALVRVVDHYPNCRKVPRKGADRPRLVVTVDHSVLCGRLGTATLLNTGEIISAQQARILACDAGILPAVMGGGSTPLDVGRERRLFTSTLRTMLVARDQGCAFPGCDAMPVDCEAHHLVPWHAGGVTSLKNGVLLCSFHHHLVEPDPTNPPDPQWSVRLDARGHPEFGAPVGRGVPPGERRWRQHQRFVLRR